MEERYAEETQTLRELLAIMHEHDLDTIKVKLGRRDLRALASPTRIARIGLARVLAFVCARTVRRADGRRQRHEGACSVDRRLLSFSVAGRAAVR